jgi:hypothetical protein
MNRFISLRWGAGLLALALVAAACGKIPDPEGVDQDGGGTDGGPDAAPRMGKATLVAHHDDQSPVVGATVVQTAPDGTLKLETVTGSDGKIELDITDGDIASVGWNESAAGGISRKLLFTVVQLEVGDVVNLNNRNERPSDTIGDIVVMTQPLPAGATTGTIDIGCGSTSISASTQVATTMQLRKDCLDSGGKFSVVADALNATGSVVASAVKLDLSAQAGQTVVMPGWVAPASARVTYTLSNAPTGASRVLGGLECRRHGIGYESFDFTGTAANPGSISVAPARGYVDAITRSAVVFFPKAGDATKVDGVVFQIAKEAYTNDSGATYTGDLSKTMARIYESTYDAASHKFTWKVQAAEPAQVMRLRDADIATITMPWNDPGSTNQQNVWVVMGPGTVDSPLQLDLHTLATLAPPASAGTLPISIQVLDLDVVDGYTDAKTRFGSDFLDSVDTLPDFRGVAAFSGELH